LERTHIILLTLVIYKLCLIGIGLWAQRRTRNETDFFLGGRSLGPFVAAISYAASASSAWTLLGVSGAAFATGLGAIWMLPGIVSAHIITWFWLAPKMHRQSHQHQHMTFSDVIAHRTNGAQRRIILMIASLIILICFICYIASQFQAAGNTFSSNFSINRHESIILGGIIILIYTWLGGFWAVSVTDAAQGTLMLIAAVALPVTALFAVGGIDGLIQGMSSVSTPEQLSFNAGNVGMLGIGFAFGLAFIGLGAFGQPQSLTRFMALGSHKDLRTAQYISVIWFMVVLSGMLVVGWAGHILIPDAANNEALFFDLTQSLFPVVIGSIITAAVLSAIMSTADSQLLVAASSVSHDLGLSRRYPERTLLIARATMAAICILSILMAIFLPASIFNRVLFAWNGMGAAFGPIIIARAMDKSIHPYSVILSMLSGFGLTAYIHALPATPGQIAERAVPFAISALIVFVGCRIKYQASAPSQ